MQTRREQVRAQRFITRRIVSALLLGDPESVDLPMRRLALALLSSTMLASVVFAAVGVYGLLSPSGAKPQEQTLIIERETGARYVYLDQVLYPVLNYVSARLILSSPDPAVRTMSRNSLSGVPRGLPVGIEGAPDTLPAPEALIGLPWTVCSRPRSEDVSTPVTGLLVGQRAAGGSQLADNALLVISDGEYPTRYLLWHNHRLKIKDRSILTALNLTSTPALPVGEPLLNAIPAGPDLAPPTLRDVGHSIDRKLGGSTARVGQLYHVGHQHYVATYSGLVPVGEVTETLMLAGNTNDREITAKEAGSALADARVEPDGFPTTVPKLRDVDVDSTATCASYVAGDSGHDVTVEVLPPSDVATVATPRNGGDQVINGIRVADQVTVDGGHGALVQAVSVNGAAAAGAPLYLVTDQGIRYPIPNKTPEAQAALGYGSVTPTPVPAALVNLIPPGPTLDPAAAKSFSGRADESKKPSSPRPVQPTPEPSAARPASSKSGSPKPAASSAKPSAHR